MNDGNSKKGSKKGPKKMGEEIGEEAVTLVIHFQRTGEGFEQMWAHVGPTVERMVRGRLLTRQVHGPFGGADEDAVQEATQQAMIQLWELSAKGAGTWFDPARGKGGVDALRAWIFGFCRKNVADYCRKWRNAGTGRRKKVITESALQMNQQMNQQTNGQSDWKSIVKSAVAKFDPTSDPGDREFRQIVNECVEGMDDEELRTLVRLNHWEGMSERQIAEQLVIHVSSVHRRLEKGECVLEKSLGARGIGPDWFDEAA